VAAADHNRRKGSVQLADAGMLEEDTQRDAALWQASLRARSGADMTNGRLRAATLMDHLLGGSDGGEFPMLVSHGDWGAVRLYCVQSGFVWWSFVLSCIAMLVVLVAIERPVEERLLRYAIWAVPERYEWTLDWAEGFCLLVLALDIGMRLRFLGGRFLVEQVGAAAHDHSC
jgi:hypothetical protein